MATLHQVLSAFQQEVSAALQGVPGVMVGIDFPSIKVLQVAVVENGGTVVAILDRGLARDTTRWVPVVLGDVVTNATLTSTLSSVALTQAQPVTVTLGGSVTNGDAVSLVLTNPAGGFKAAQTQGGANTQSTPQWAIVVSGGATDTPSTMAAKLAAAVNADPVLSSWVTASASGPVVTLTTTQARMLVASHTGNGGTRTTEIGRRQRQIQVVVWTDSIEDRDIAGDAIESVLTQMRMMLSPYDAGLSLSDGTNGQLGPVRDYNLDDGTLANAYRRDFMVSIDHPITTQDALWSVLAPVTQYQFDQT